MPDLNDLATMLDKENSEYKEIPVASLTRFELEELKKNGVDVSGKTVKVLTKPPKTFKQPEAEPAAEQTAAQPQQEVITPTKLESPSTVSAVPEPAPETPAMPKVAVSADDAHEYLRCLLGGKGFCKLYKMMGDKVSIEFASRTAEESFILSSILRDIRTHMGIANFDIVNSTFLAYQLLYTCKQIRLGDKVVVVEKPVSKDFDVIKACNHKLLSQVPLGIYKAILVKLIEFETLVAALDDKVNDPNFWEQTGA